MGGGNPYPIGNSEFSITDAAKWATGIETEQDAEDFMGFLSMFSGIGIGTKALSSSTKLAEITELLGKGGVMLYLKMQTLHRKRTVRLNSVMKGLSTSQTLRGKIFKMLMIGSEHLRTEILTLPKFQLITLLGMGIPLY